MPKPSDKIVIEDEWDVKPTDKKPVETKPVEAKPVETKPILSKQESEESDIVPITRSKFEMEAKKPVVAEIKNLEIKGAKVFKKGDSDFDDDFD